MRIQFYSFTAVFCLAFAAHAEPPKGELPAHASPSDVRRLWGEPKSVTEYEIDRKSVWHYKDGAQVTFNQARVTDWRSPSVQERREPKPEKGEEQKRLPAKDVDDRDPPDIESRDIVREIAREVPSGPDSPSGDPGSSIQPPNPVVQGQMIPNPGVYNPNGVMQGGLLPPGNDD